MVSLEEKLKFTIGVYDYFLVISDILQLKVFYSPKTSK